MYKYWLIYTTKGEFKGFKAIGFNNMDEINWFKNQFKESHIFIAITTEAEESISTIKIKSIEENYAEFVEELKAEGDTDIPSFEQYKNDIKKGIS